MLQRNCKFQFLILKPRIAYHELNLELQFSEEFAESNFEIASC